jgi:hypothetical protein
MGYKVCNYVYVILYEMYVWLIVERIVPPDNYIAITGCCLTHNISLREYGVPIKMAPGWNMGGHLDCHCTKWIKWTLKSVVNNNS